MIIRAHECVMDGFERFAGMKIDERWLANDTVQCDRLLRASQKCRCCLNSQKKSWNRPQIDLSVKLQPTQLDWRRGTTQKKTTHSTKMEKQSGKKMAWSRQKISWILWSSLHVCKEFNSVFTCLHVRIESCLDSCTFTIFHINYKS